MCGVFGIRAPERDVARVTFFGLFALQHRGQESAGIAVSDAGRLTVLRDMGLVAQVFDEQNLSGLQGEVAIGHTRYSTTGSTQWTNAQPIVQHGRTRTVTLGHNGNLTNTQELRDELAAEGITLSTTSDTEVIAALIANDPAPLVEAVANTMARLEGAYTIVALAEGKLIGFRDPYGFRPLNLGSIDGDPVLASETCALDLVGAKHEREVAPGELVLIDEQGVHETQAVRQAGDGALCLFEFIYLARPDSLLVGHRGARRPRAHGRATREGGAGRGRPRHARPRLGHAGGDRVLARQRDPLLGRPDQEPLRRPDVHRARRGAPRAGHPPQVQPAVRGRRQARRPRRRLDRPRQHDPADRRSCSSTRAPRRCTSGSPRRRSSRPASTESTSPTRSSSVAASRTVEGVQEQIGATSLAYITLEGVQEATTRPASEMCRACFTRDYPTRIPADKTLAKFRFEPSRA